MKQLVIEAEDDVAAKLEQVAPGCGLRRSEFIGKAIRRALWELEEEETAEAYRRHPGSGDDVYLDRSAWEASSNPTRKRSRR